MSVSIETPEALAAAGAASGAGAACKVAKLGGAVSMHPEIPIPLN